VIDAGDKGTVFVLETNGATLRGCTSPARAIRTTPTTPASNVRGHRNLIENLVIDDCLFGIDLKQSTTTSCAATASAPSPSTSACAATACACGTATAT
jgi:hypothetical protein